MQRFTSEARASPRPRKHLFSFPGAASNFAASGEYDRKRGRHHDQGSLGGTLPGALRNRIRGQHYDSHSFMSTRRMAKSGGARRGFLVIVLNRTAAEQTDLCAKVRTMFLLTTGSEMFSKSSSPVVRRGGARER